MAVDPGLLDSSSIDAVGAAAPSIPGPVMGCKCNVDGIDPAEILRSDLFPYADHSRMVVGAKRLGLLTGQP